MDACIGKETTGVHLMLVKTWRQISPGSIPILKSKDEYSYLFYLKVKGKKGKGKIFAYF